MEQEEVLIHGVSYNAMCQILHFIYTSELELNLSNVQETLVAACQLQVGLASGSSTQARPAKDACVLCPPGSDIGPRVCQEGVGAPSRFILIFLHPKMCIGSTVTVWAAGGCPVPCATIWIEQ